ncbi:MAG: universal stress protein [Planctomycetes bacterium]|nr:universal stress protein [Planctomycetota bacterium]
MKVLCGVDGSANGFAALRFVARLLNPATDQIALYYTPPELRAGLLESCGPEVLDRARRALAEAIFNECRGRLPEALARNVHTIIGQQQPQRGLLIAADEWQAGMIVVGARGAGPISRLLLGSVSTTVAQSAKAPVLVVRAPEGDQPSSPLRVLVAYDGSDASRHATDLLRQLTWPADAAGRVMTVCEPMLVGQLPEWLEKQPREPEFEAMSQMWVREHEAENRATHDELSAYSQTLPAAFHHDPLVVEGDPADEILKAIDREGSDLIVMGARGLGALERLFLGSTSQKVLSHAPCSVLLVRETEKP